MEAKVTWQKDLTFQAHLDDHTFHIDSPAYAETKSKGPKPKGLTLISLVGCTGMDVISILKKMKVEVDHFEVSASAILAPEHPKKFERVLVRYILNGKDIPADKVKRAVSLSEERYCGVSATLKPNVVIESEIVINEQRIE